MGVAETIRGKLEEAFRPVHLEIVDESHLHLGHAGAPDGGESHFRVEITAAAFAGRSRVERQRLVYACLADELAGPVHALSVAAGPPADATP
jgi:BolA protein